MTKDQWAPHVPQNCPYPHSTDSNGDAFRLVGNDPPAATDLLSHTERGLAPNAEPCDRAGVSVFISLETAKELRAGIKSFRNRKIACATLAPPHGRWCPTGKTKGHLTFWPRFNVHPTLHQLFGVVA